MMREKKRDLLEQAIQVLAEYDHPLTLRQLYYRLVAAHVLENAENQYKRLSALLVEARESGFVSPDALEDRTRAPHKPSAWCGLDGYLETVRDAYRRDKWDSQPVHLEVWVEKDALGAMIERVTGPWDVYSYACRGYNSFSALWEAAGRFEEIGKPVVVLYLGDFDPSGVDMTRDVRDRLSRYTSAQITVRRLALTKEQIIEHDLPPMPAKRSDTRAPAFIEEHGEISAVELDALPPDVLTALVAEAIRANCDLSEFERQRQIEADERAQWHEHLEELAV